MIPPRASSDRSGFPTSTSVSACELAKESFVFEPSSSLVVLAQAGTHIFNAFLDPRLRARGFTQVVIPEAGLPDIFDFAGKPSYPGSTCRAPRRGMDPGSQRSQTESPKALSGSPGVRDDG